MLSLTKGNWVLGILLCGRGDQGDAKRVLWPCFLNLFVWRSRI